MSDDKIPVTEFYVKDDEGDCLTVQVLPWTWAKNGCAYVQIAPNMWGKPGVAEAIKVAVEAAFPTQQVQHGRPGTIQDALDEGHGQETSTTGRVDDTD